VDAQISIGVGCQWGNSVLGPAAGQLANQALDGLLGRSIQDQALSIGLGSYFPGGLQLY